MRYWWVNQNQTFRQEFDGGYLWSPKRNSANGLNPFYETMREVSPGDLIFSFYDTKIVAIGVASSYCRENPKPDFGNAGQNWSDVGWRVDVDFTELKNVIRPKDHYEDLRHLMPTIYAPLNKNGNGNQGIYLTELREPLALALIGKIGIEAHICHQSSAQNDADHSDDIEKWERRIARSISLDRTIPRTERHALIRARVGQGTFKRNVSKIESLCRVTRVDNGTHLVASHCKPWRDATNEERLDGENGLLLTPTIDHLFDRGFIGFEDNGRLIVSPVAHQPSLQRMGIDPTGRVNVGAFSEGQRRFLDFHRDKVLLQSVRR